MVMVLFAQAAVTPEGKPVGVPMPLATEVLCVILLNGVLIQSEGVIDAALTVFKGVTIITALPLKSAAVDVACAFDKVAMV